MKTVLPLPHLRDERDESRMHAYQSSGFIMESRSWLRGRGSSRLALLGLVIICLLVGGASTAGSTPSSTASASCTTYGVYCYCYLLVRSHTDCANESGSRNYVNGYFETNEAF